MQQICIHIPHASTQIPNDVRSQFCVSDDVLRTELLKLTDWHTDDLFSVPNVESITSPVSRFVVDVERFSDDEAEPMAKRGMGAIYMQGTGGEAIRRPLRSPEREQLLDRYYRPHHAALNTWAEAAIGQYGTCLLIDAHSFPSKPLPCHMSQHPLRPDVCIGTDAFHTPPEMVRHLTQLFENFSYSVLVDEPYAGALVPSAFWRKDPRVASIMIEINRALYMNEVDGSKSINFDTVKSHVAEAIEVCKMFIAT